MQNYSSLDICEPHPLKLLAKFLDAEWKIILVDENVIDSEGCAEFGMADITGQ